METGLAERKPMHEPLPAGQPHVAFVLLWYPLFTQPFIFREVESLARVMPVEVYTLYGRNLRHCSAEMINAGGRAQTYGAKKFLPICGVLLKEAVCCPSRFWHLFKRSLWRPWPSLETFGENLWAFAAGFTLARRFQEDGIDFVYAPWPRGAATAAWVGATLAGLPFGIAARGDNLAPADPDLGAKLAAATFVRANNQADQRRIEKFEAGQAAGKTNLIYNSLTLPVPEAQKTARFSSDLLRLLALGRFDVTKGFDILLKACAILKQRNVNFHLTLAGGGGKVMGLGDLGKTLRQLRTDLNLMAEVSMPGLISHDELPAILQQHDIFVAPCVVHASGRRDGIPNTVIEALAFGMPVISTNVNALPEVVRNGETGFTVPPGDATALANAICEMAENPQKAVSMGERGCALARMLFDPAANAARMAEMFRNACNGKARKAACAG